MNIAKIIYDELNQFNLVKINIRNNIGQLHVFPYFIKYHSNLNVIIIRKIKYYPTATFEKYKDMYQIQSHFDFDVVGEVIKNVLTNYYF
jgi:hypothetical protein